MMKMIVAIFLVVAITGHSEGLTQESSPEMIRVQVSNAMNRIIIPSIRMTNTTIVDFANVLVDESVKHDPDHCGVSIIVNMNYSDAGTNHPAIKNFTINAQNIRYRDLLNMACDLADCEWSQTTIPIVSPKKTKIVEQEAGVVREPRGGSRAPQP
jgi:hypothetical protein